MKLLLAGLTLLAASSLGAQARDTVPAINQLNTRQFQRDTIAKTKTGVPVTTLPLREAPKMVQAPPPPVVQAPAKTKADSTYKVTVFRGTDPADAKFKKDSTEVHRLALRESPGPKEAKIESLVIRGDTATVIMVTGTQRKRLRFVRDHTYGMFMSPGVRY